MFMQSIKKILLLSLIAASVAACGDSRKQKRSDLTEKKEHLEKLKKEQAELNAKVKKLENEITAADTAGGKADKAKLVVLDTIQTEDFTHYIDLQGRVDAENISYITPRGMGGQVKAVYVKEGQYVKKGQLLLKLEIGRA